MGKKFISSIFIGLVVVCFHSTILAGPVPDTRQTNCYIEDYPGRWIVAPCPEPGTPFYGQDAQYTINPPSFTKLDALGNDLSDDAESWVMLRDNVTGLIWEVKVNLDGFTDYANPNDADNRYTWYDSNPDTNGGNAGVPSVGIDTEDYIDSLNSLQFGGFSNWRLPTDKETAMIFDRHKEPNDWPFIDTDFFPNVRISQDHRYMYWSSTTDANSTAQAIAFDFVDYDGMFIQDKSNMYFVRAVHGPNSQENNFYDNGDGTISDLSTGLIWQQDSLPYNWEGALAYCENLTLEGYSDWRLPSINEILTLLDNSKVGLAIDIDYFSNTADESYWSSTSLHLTDRAWVVSFDQGRIKLENKQFNFYVRAVRGGYNGPNPPLPPLGNAGPDQIVSDAIILDGSQSYDPDGTIVIHEWEIKHRQNSAYDRTAVGEIAAVSDLEPGFYDVILTVTDDDGYTDTDTIILAVAGPCDGWPHPNADFNLKEFNITKVKKRNYTTTTMFGTIDLPPDLNLGDGDMVRSRITLELFDALPDGHLVVSDEATLTVSDGKHRFIIKK